MSCGSSSTADALEATSGLHSAVSIVAASVDDDVVAVRAVLAMMLVHPANLGDVGSVGNDLVDPLARTNSLVPAI